MSQQSTRTLRRATLAVATVSLLLAAPAFADERVMLGGLDPQQPVAGFLVTYRNTSAKDAGFQSKLDAAIRTLGRKDLSLKYVRPVSTGAELIEASRPLDLVEATTLMQQLAADPDLVSVEPNAIFRIALTPNDTNYPSQWGLHGTYGIRANTAWDNGYRGAGKIIAVVDTGITNHPDLVANLTTPRGYDFISNATTANDGNGRDSDPSDPGDWCSPNPSSWHGTHVTGIAAAVTNNASGVAGAAFNSKVLSVRVLGKCGGTLADIADGITWASGGTVAGVPAVGANKASVINMSLGGSGACSASSAMQLAINGAVSRGTTVVVAAGNSNADSRNFQPASCANVINVAATTSAGVRASFSNWGTLIDIAAPGQSILSTLNTGTTTPGSPSYANYNGTSMAAPFVAAVVALMQSKPGVDRTPAQAEAIIKANFSPFATPQSPVIGPGILNADAATDATP